MKDILIEKVKPIPSCPAEFVQMPEELVVKQSEDETGSTEGYRRVRRSAAMIGLAISMGATGILLPKQEDKALAAEAINSQPTLTSFSSKKKVARSSSPKPAVKSTSSSDKLAAKKVLTVARAKVVTTPKSSSVSQIVKIASPAIAHRVDSGETIWTLARKYQVDPEAIAASNNLKPETTLSVGQTLKIPSVNGIVREIAQEGETLEQISDSYGVEAKQLQLSEEVSPGEKLPAGKLVTIPGKVDYLLQQQQNYALKSLRSKQKSLRQSLAQLKLSPQQSSRSERSAAVASKESAIIQRWQKPILLTEVNNKLDLPQPKLIARTPDLVYVVKPGDTLDLIARRFRISLTELVQANDISNPNLIEVNQRLSIPQISQSENTIPTFSNSSGNYTARRSRFSSAPLVSAEVDEATKEVKSQSVKQRNQSVENLDNQTSPKANSYIQKLRADIERLQEEYKNQRASNKNQARELTTNASQSLVSPLNNNLAVASESSTNPEWLKQRLQRQTNQSSSNTFSIQSRSRRRLELPVLSPLRRFSADDSNAQKKLVVSAPRGVQNYNQLLRTTTGDKVTPELPPLSSPEQYLPDNPNIPTRFNGYIWPAKAVLTSGYGWRWGRMHKGIDLAGPIGTPILAAASGEVVSAGWNSGGFGNLIKLKHPDGSTTIYAHNNRILVRRGQRVRQGQQIAEMGSTGYSTGPHLHFEIHPKGRGAVNPMAYLSKNRR